MTNVKSPHNADASYIGYVYQGQYALLLLLDAAPDTFVSVETDDDVTLEGQSPTLVQLKHSSAAQPPAVTIKNIGWWKTLNIWLNHPRRADVSFLFVTCAPLQTGSSLAALRPNTAGGTVDLETLANDLIAEANRVLRERSAARASSPPTPLPHADRAAGCETVGRLGKDELLRLLERTTIVDGAAPASTIEAEVTRHLRKTLPPKKCDPVARRLMEWWDHRVTRALLGHDAREIGHLEYVTKLNDLIQAHGEERLPDDFSDLEPSAEELELELSTMMERQIHLVGGGRSRVLRAARVRWQARSQRGRWLEEDISLAPELNRYDTRLVQAWSDQHGPMCDDTLGFDQIVKAKEGLRILEWSHNTAHGCISPPRAAWPHPFLAQGQLQELAELQQVGWHPDYRTELTETPESGEL